MTHPFSERYYRRGVEVLEEVRVYELNIPNDLDDTDKRTLAQAKMIDFLAAELQAALLRIDDLEKLLHNDGK